jgi:hypothetical protein
MRRDRREHPGQLIRRHVLDRDGLSIGEAAHLLGVPVRTLLDVLVGKAAPSRNWLSGSKRYLAGYSGRSGDDLAEHCENESDLNTT